MRRFACYVVCLVIALVLIGLSFTLAAVLCKLDSYSSALKECQERAFRNEEQLREIQEHLREQAERALHDLNEFRSKMNKGQQQKPDEADLRLERLDRLIKELAGEKKEKGQG